MASLKKNQILIMGGYCVGSYYKGQGLILDVATAENLSSQSIKMRTEKVLGKQASFEFEALSNQCRQTMNGQVAGIVLDFNNVLQLITYNHA